MFYVSILSNLAMLPFIMCLGEPASNEDSVPNMWTV